MISNRWHGIAVKAMVCMTASSVMGCHWSGAVVVGDSDPTAVHVMGEQASAEYDRDGIIRMIQSRIDAEQPDMSIQDVVAKKMKLSDYFEQIDQEDIGMTVEDLMPSDQAQNARASDVWVVGFRTQDQLDQIGGWFITPPLSPTLEVVPSTILGAEGKAVGLMVFDSWTGECIAANLIPSDWEHAKVYDRLVQYGP